ncbi:hypothetical protein C8Z91_19460 [Paenibacillus elgii]|uniref:NEAT domain-containing protein n=1 Tax=Paenibacillus elgii TaxID=189691 RepID=A0A2T6G034_9BACL|nr:hypothetical protein [Paenibacillus elgii]PUA37523.1 hypothetical protein C8Z91_19460 [Paenibacillus elgii]
MKKLLLLALCLSLTGSTAAYAYQPQNDPPGIRNKSNDVMDYFSVETSKEGSFFFTSGDGKEDLKPGVDGSIYRVVISSNVNAVFTAVFPDGSEQAFEMDKSHNDYLSIPVEYGVKSLKIKVGTDGTRTVQANLHQYRVHTEKNNFIFNYKKWKKKTR